MITMYYTLTNETNKMTNEHNVRVRFHLLSFNLCPTNKHLTFFLLPSCLPFHFVPSRYRLQIINKNKYQIFSLIYDRINNIFVYNS